VANLAIVIISLITVIVAECLFFRKTTGKVSEAVFVGGVLFAKMEVGGFYVLYKKIANWKLVGVSFLHSSFCFHTLLEWDGIN